MEMVWSIVAGTPLWVWFAFALGLFMGVNALRGKTLRLWTVFIPPAVFLALSVPSVVERLGRSPELAALWLVALVGGAAAGWFWLSPAPLSVDRARRTLRLPGSPAMLLLFVLVFSVKYAWGVAGGMRSPLVDEQWFRLAVFGLSGLCSGAVLCRSAKYIGILLGRPALAGEA